MRYISLFSGVEAATLAFAPLGWECVGVAEIDPFPCAVLKHRFPDVPNLGSVIDITEEQIAALGQIDLVVGGSPCQDLSVAGKRVGLAGARSGLFAHQMRIFNAARHLCGARWLLWENVPGAFSTNRGRDFAVVVGEMAGCRVDVPADGWGSEGVALGTHGLVEWAVLDAQWFGVAQRRRRVFAILDTGDWINRPPVLFEQDSLRGDTAPSREAREGTAGGAPAGAGNGRWPADVASTLNASFGSKQGLEDQHIRGGAPLFVPHTAHTLRAEGFDASEDGTGRGTPLVPVSVAMRGRDGGAACEVGDECAFTLRASSGGGDKPHALVPVAFSCKDHGETHANGGGQVAVAFMADDYKDGGYEECDTERPLTTSADRTRAAPIACMEVAGTMKSCKDSGGWSNSADHAAAGYMQVTPSMQVRRLTPRECERLQGMPDDWTLIPYRGKPMDKCPDGPRYKAIGNSMAVPVMAWIGRQIKAAADHEAAPW